jgi:hypothetical protein
VEKETPAVQERDRQLNADQEDFLCLEAKIVMTCHEKSYFIYEEDTV